MEGGACMIEETGAGSAFAAAGAGSEGGGGGAATGAASCGWSGFEANV
jgi:hypothetical protein